MAKNAKRSAGPTVNPAPQPTATSAERGAGNAESAQAAGAAAPAAPAPRRAQGIPTVASPPAEPRVTDAQFESEAMGLLLGPDNASAKPQRNGSDARRPAKAKARAKAQANPDAHLGAMDEADLNDDAADTTPAAEDQTAQEANFTGQDGAEDDAAGDNQSSQEQQQQAEAETEVEAEADANAGDDTDDEATNVADDDPWPKSAVKKVGKLRGRVETLQEQLETVQAELAELKQQPASNAPEPVAVTDGELNLNGQIDSMRNRASLIKQAIRAAERAGDERVSVTFPGADKPIECSLGDAEQALETLGDQIADKKGDLRNLRTERQTLRTAFEQAVKERHPWMSDKANPARAKVEDILRRYPALQQMPEARFWIAGAMAFEAVLSAERGTRSAKQNGNGSNGNGHANGNGRPAPAPRSALPAPRLNRPGAAPMPVNRAKAGQNSAMQRFAKNGDPEAGKELVASLLMD